MPETSETPYESTSPDAAEVQGETALATVGTRRQRTHRQSGRLKHAFLQQFARYGNLGYSAALVQVHRNTVYGWLETDEAFSAAFHQAEAAAVEVLEQEAWRRAVEGSPYERTSYWHGEPVGTDRKTEYSDALMTLLLRARAPEKYREKLDVSVQQVVKTVVGLDPSEVL
jgi:hypothetical protein